ncbi:MAG: acyl-CoA thioesterase [Clostridia bacterium]
MYASQFVVFLHDVDKNFIARPSSIVRYMQEATNQQMRDQRPSYQELFNNGYAFILSRFNLNIYHPMAINDVLTVKVWASFSGSVTYIRSYVIERDNVVCAEASGIWVLLEIAKNRFVPFGEVDLSNYSTYPPLQTTLSRRITLPNAQFSKVGQVNVMYGQIDCNGHLNNTNYADMLYHFCVDRDLFNPIEMTFHYIAEAPLNSPIDIYSYSVEKGDVKTYYFKTFVADKPNVVAEFVLRKKQ